MSINVDDPGDTANVGSNCAEDWVEIEGNEKRTFKLSVSYTSRY